MMPQRLIPGVKLKPGEPRLTTIAVRPLEAYEGEDRYAVLAVDEGDQYIVWTVVVVPGGVEGGETINGTYLRFSSERDLERLFLRAFADWLGRT